MVRDFQCKRASDMIDVDFANRMRFLKETEEGRFKMCEVMDRYVAEVLKEKNEIRNIEIAQNMLRLNKYSYEDIADATELSLEKVLELAKQQSA